LEPPGEIVCRKTTLPDFFCRSISFSQTVRSLGLIHLIRNRWGLSPLTTGVLISTILVVYFFILALSYGDFWSSNGIIGYIDDYSLLNNLIFGILPVITFYFLIPEYIQQCFEKLADNKIFSSPKIKQNSNHFKYKGLDEFTTAAQKSLSSKWWIIAGVILATIFLLIALPEHFKARHWIVRHWFSVLSFEVIWWVAFSLTVILVLRSLAGIWWIDQVFRNFKITLHPLHPDRVGGLRPLSEFSMRLGYLIFFFGLELGLNQYFTSYTLNRSWGNVLWSSDIVLAWVIYILLAPIVFFAPIQAAHDAMQEAKNHEIQIISDHFEEEYKQIHNNLKKPMTSLRVHSDKIDELQKLYALVNTFPVWPFDIKIFAGFSATILSPLFLTILSSLISTWAPIIWNGL